MTEHLRKIALVLLLCVSLLLAGCEEEKSFIVKNAQRPDIERIMLEYIAMKGLSLIGNSAGLGIYNFVEERHLRYGDTNRYFTVLLKQKDADVYIKANTEGYSLDSAYFYTEGFLNELAYNGYAVVTEQGLN